MSNELMEMLAELGEIICNIWKAVISKEITEMQARELISEIGQARADMD